MKIPLIVIISIITLLVEGGLPVGAETMSSANYRISTTMMSGGGGPMQSGSYKINATLGQPSPLIDPSLPPQSLNYDLLTGFWYTLDAGMDGCRWDIEPLLGDDDVDGADLAEYLNAYDPMTLPAFAAEFGRIDCF